METATQPTATPSPLLNHTLAQYPRLEAVTKPNLTTAECAFYLNRRPQTLRIWAMRDGIEGLRPMRIGGLLAWPLASVKTLAGVQA